MNFSRLLRGIGSAMLLSFSLVICTAESNAQEATPSSVGDTLPVEVKSEMSQPLTWQLPYDITSPSVVNTQSLQWAFDVFSWQSFIALNWPANSDGTPNAGMQIGVKDAVTVWEKWLHTSDIFLPDGSQPKAWGSSPDLVAYCQNKLPKNDAAKILQQAKKISDFLILSTEPMDTGPVIDQNGKYLQYEINLNEVMYNYIVSNELYNVEGQEAFAKMGKQVDFWSGSNKDKQVGTIMAKGAWKILGKGDDHSRFHTVEAIVFSNPGESGDGMCRLETVGLVGFHVATKTKSAPQWVWSSFEQVDNAPEEQDGKVPADACDKGKHYNFYNCDEYGSPTNQMAKQPWNLDTPGQTPTQVSRVVPLTKETKWLNQQYQEKLRQVNPDSPWQYYMLLSTQWPTKPGDPTSFQNPDPKGSPAPMVLANTTLETFTQGFVPQIGTSCMDCHFSATNSVGKWTDFTYTLGMAHKKSKGEKK